MPLLVLLCVYALPVGNLVLELSVSDRAAVLAFVVAVGAWLSRRHREVVVGSDGLLLRSAFLRAETFVPYADVVSVAHEQALWAAGPGTVRLRCHDHRPEAFVFGSCGAAAGNRPEVMVAAIEAQRRRRAEDSVPVAVASIRASGDDFEAWFRAQRAALRVGAHRRLGVELTDTWRRVVRSATTPLQQAVVAWVVGEATDVRRGPSPAFAEVAAQTAHPKVATTLRALGRDDRKTARDAIAALWGEEGCGEAIALRAAAA